jgi:hypothetical protein
MATHELVVPKSMPITFAIYLTPQDSVRRFARAARRYLIIAWTVFNRAVLVFFLV